MIDTPAPWWLTAALAAILAADALFSIRPPAVIRGCLDGVNFPREWAWTLIVIKLSAAAGLLAGLKYPGIGFATNAAVIGYFICASVAHIRARFLEKEFWISCLGMLAISTAVLTISYA